MVKRRVLKFESGRVGNQNVSVSEKVRPRRTSRNLGFFGRSECVVIGDGLSGVKSGKAVSCCVAAVPSYFTKDQDFSVADIAVSSLGDKRLRDFIVE